jgi:hypothetical protein
MRFYWIRDRVRQGHFHVYWKRGSLNRADYFTKHHPASHHQQIRSSYLHSKDDRSTNYFDCLRDDQKSDSVKKHEIDRLKNHANDRWNSGEGVLKYRSPGSHSNPDLNDHDPNANPNNSLTTHKLL